MRRRSGTHQGETTIALELLLGDASTREQLSEAIASHRERFVID